VIDIKNINTADNKSNIDNNSKVKNPTTGLVAFGVSGRLRLQNF
jgi:hypothetical protein